MTTAKEIVYFSDLAHFIPFCTTFNDFNKLKYVEFSDDCERDFKTSSYKTLL